jgi:cytochrome d ubiquinol oxidase subunit II
MDLPLLSASFLAFALTLYVILDGFDLGVGILLLFQPAKASRDHMVDSITPTWDGNETWIIMAGVTLLAAFPIAYSILLPAFYLPVILMLLAAFMQGVIVGGLIQGVTVQNQRFAGGVLNIVRSLPIISGVTLLFGYAVLGSGWLKLKSNPSVQHFASRSLRVAAPVFAVLFGIDCIYAFNIQPGIRSQWASHGTALSCLVALFAVVAGTLTALTEKSRPALPFFLGLCLFVVGISGMALIVFPYIVPFSLSLWDAASSSRSQQFVLIGAAFVTPVVLAYSAFAYWIFRGRTPEEGWGE